MAIPNLANYGAKLNSAIRTLIQGSDDQPTISALNKGIGTLLSNIDPGAPAVAVLNMATNPTDTNTVTIGADVYEFATAAGALANDTNIGVVIGANAGATRDSFIAAINATVSAATGLTKSGGGAAEANGTENYIADEVGTEIRIRSANAPGGTIVADARTTAVSETLANASDIWSSGNASIASGRAAAQMQYGIATKTIAAANITFLTQRVSFGNTDGAQTVVAFLTDVRSSTGVKRGEGADTFTIDNGDVLITFGGGVAPDIQANDVVTIIAAMT